MYKTQQRQLRTQMLTRMGWIEATLHLPERAFLADFLTHAPEFVTLTDVVSPGRPEPVPYFSLSHDALRLVSVPDGVQAENQENKRPALDNHRVYLVLDMGTVTGDVETLKGTRVSDFFAHRRGFVLLKNAQLEIGPMGAAPSVSESRPRVLVSADHLVGVGEL